MRSLLALLLALVAACSSVAPGCAHAMPITQAAAHHGTGGMGHTNRHGHDEGMRASCLGCGLSLPGLPTLAARPDAPVRVPPTSSQPARPADINPDPTDPPPRRPG